MLRREAGAVDPGSTGVKAGETAAPPSKEAVAQVADMLENCEVGAGDTEGEDDDRAKAAKPATAAQAPAQAASAPS